MNLWIDAKEAAPKSWLYPWVQMVEVDSAIDTIMYRIPDVDPVKLINVHASLANEFCAKLDAVPGPYEVHVHGGEIPPEAAKLIMKNHWDKKVMDERTTELIMVLKGNHDLAESLPEDMPQLGAYLQDVALYLSDDCMCPFSTYAKSPGCMSGVIHNAVTDYMKACENPSFLVWEYFETKRQWGDRYTDDQCWCVALMMTQVRNDNQYINGFSEANTKHYKRKRQFLP